MKRITTVLKEPTALEVRNAVCVAGAERVVITPLTYRMCGVDIVDIYSEKVVAETDKNVRLDVITDNSRSASIISAIQEIAHAGRIALSSRHDMLPRRTAYNQ